MPRHALNYTPRASMSIVVPCKYSTWCILCSMLWAGASVKVYGQHAQVCVPLFAPVAGQDTFDQIKKFVMATAFAMTATGDVHGVVCCQSAFPGPLMGTSTSND